MGKVLFTPVSIISGLLAGLLASKLFEFIWGRVAGEEAPEPDDLARRMGDLKRTFGFTIVGGCCGTDAEHLARIADACR